MSNGTATQSHRQLDKDGIKQDMQGYCRAFLRDVYKFDPPEDTSREYPCHKCGGNTRARTFTDYDESGGYYCSHCFKKKNGDFLATAQWLSDKSFPDVLQDAANWLESQGRLHRGLAASSPGRSQKQSVSEDTDLAAHGTRLKPDHSVSVEHEAKPKRKFDRVQKASDYLSKNIFGRPRNPDAVWQYTDRDGKLVGVVLRWNTEKPPFKEIRPVRKTSDGNWELSGMPSPRPLYRLPTLLDASEVHVFEGEKSADTAVQLGLVATSPAHGAQSPHKTDWSPLNGKTVIIYPDHDQAGRDFAVAVLKLIRQQAPRAKVRIVDLQDDWQGIPEKGDLYDWEQQFDTATKEDLLQRLRALQDRTYQFCQEGEDSGNTSSHAEPIVPKQTFIEGQRVRCGDRGNIGTIEADDGGDTVAVHFVSADGVSATVDIPRDQVSSLDGLSGDPSQQINIETFSAWDLIDAETPLDEEIIAGTLRRGEVCNIIAATKIGKSWLALGLACAVATGRRWLGRETAKGNVLLIDNELRPATLRHRIATVLRAMGVKHDESHARLEVASLRGQFADIQSLEHALRIFKRDEFALIILDAKYRAFGALDENSNTDQTLFHNAVDKIAGDMNSGFMMVHHSSKGDQAGKSTTDVGSGGGSQSRAVDTHLIIRPHTDEGYAVLDAAVRSFAPVESQTLQWEFPLWHLAAAVEPILKAERSRGDSRQESKDLQALGQLTDILHSADEPITRYELLKQFGGGKERVNRLIRLGIQNGRIAKVGTREARNGEQADTFMVCSRAEMVGNSDDEKNGLF